MDNINKIEELFGQGDIEQVIEYIQRLDKGDFFHHKIQNILGIINLQICDYDNAEVCFKKAIEGDSENISYLLNLEYLYEKKNYFKEAKDIIEKIKIINNGDISIEEINSISASLSDKAKNKNVLMIAYYFPPLAGSGVFRSLKFSKYLPAFDWNVNVISAENPPEGWKFEDESLCDEINKNIYVRRINDEVCTSGKVSSDPKEDIAFLGLIFNELPNAKKLFLDILGMNNGYDFLSKFPCPSLNWAHKVSKYIDNMVHVNNFDIIYTTSGPYSSHLVGYYINKKYGIPWVADFRDEWVFAYFGHIRTLIPGTSGQHNGNIRTA